MWLRVAGVFATVAAILASHAFASAQQADLSERSWYDGATRCTIWMAADRLAVLFDTTSIPGTREEAEQRIGRSSPGAVLDTQEGAVAVFRLAGPGNPDAPAHALRNQKGVRHASPVFYQGSRGATNPLVLSGEIIVGFKTAMTPDDLMRFSRKYGIVLLQPLGVIPNTFVFDARASTDSLALANAIFETGQVTLAQPNWIQRATRR